MYNALPWQQRYKTGISEWVMEVSPRGLEGERENSWWVKEREGRTARTGKGKDRGDTAEPFKVPSLKISYRGSSKTRYN